MQLNTDDTLQEQYINSMHRNTDVMINCERCARLYYIDLDIAKRKYDKKIPLLCLRCRKIERSVRRYEDNNNQHTPATR